MFNKQQQQNNNQTGKEIKKVLKKGQPRNAHDMRIALAKRKKPKQQKQTLKERQQQQQQQTEHKQTAQQKNLSMINERRSAHSEKLSDVTEPKQRRELYHSVLSERPAIEEQLHTWRTRFSKQGRQYLRKMHNKAESNVVEGLIDLTAGSLGGIAQVYVSQPFDTVKVKQQTFPKIYKNMFDCFMKTYRTDGILRGLYAGSIPAMIANVAENSVLFAAYGGCQKFVAYLTSKPKVTDLTTLENAFAGCLASFFSTFALCPTELIKCKLQALEEMKKHTDPRSKTMPRTPWSLTRYIYQREGLGGFFRGLRPTFVREMPGYFFFFGAYEGTRELLRGPDQTKDEIGALATMASGAVGGVTLWTVTFPADVIKSRIQIQNINKGMLTVGMDIIKHEGIAGLYNGLLPSIIRTIPATATLFLVYENTKKILQDLC